jgi:hypothetical protein
MGRSEHATTDAFSSLLEERGGEGGGTTPADESPDVGAPATDPRVSTPAAPTMAAGARLVWVLRQGLGRSAERREMWESVLVRTGAGRAPLPGGVCAPLAGAERRALGGVGGEAVLAAPAAPAQAAAAAAPPLVRAPRQERGCLPLGLGGLLSMATVMEVEARSRWW